MQYMLPEIKVFIARGTAQFLSSIPNYNNSPDDNKRLMRNAFKCTFNLAISPLLLAKKPKRFGENRSTT
jgi:hypothetical protein